ncbi:MAG: 2Fe-2S iron-sulfur cluster-binding protein [Campylobacterota bacterium]|nr:2Fe-2S iron-sulfur cluster-binding protein [Campylobacterota bacterium]
MVNVIFCGFGEDADKRVFAKQGDLLLRVAENNGIKIPTECKEGNCGSCAVRIEELTITPTDGGSEVDPDNWSKDAQTTYMDDRELDTLVEMGAISRTEADAAQQYVRQTPVRLACQCVIKNEILVKPFD